MNFMLTALLWVYFLFGYFLILLFLFIPSYLRFRNGEAVLQKMNHVHMKIFFSWLRILTPSTRFMIDADVRGLRSSIIVCNHISYLDPILLVSLFERHTTIVKSTFFTVPVFGWFLEKAGYLPSSSSSSDIFDPAMSAGLEKIKSHLSAGGNLFVFPEGTRGRKGRLLPFNKGVFSIARHCHAPLVLVLIRNTDQLFPPGSFSFRMHGEKTVCLKTLTTLTPDYRAENFSAGALADEARQLFIQAGGGRRHEKSNV